MIPIHLIDRTYLGMSLIQGHTIILHSQTTQRLWMVQSILLHLMQRMLREMLQRELQGPVLPMM